MLVSLEQPAQVAGEHGDDVPHVQSDVSAPVAAQEVPTVRGVLDTCTAFIVGSVLSLLPGEASPEQADCTASILPDQQQPELSAAALDRGMPSAQVQPAGVQVLAADREVPDIVDPSLSHEAAGAEGCDGMADGVAALSAAAPCPPSPSSVDVLVAPPPQTAGHVSEPTQGVQSGPLRLPGTRQFGAVHITESGDVSESGDAAPVDAESGDARSGDADRKTSMASAKPSDKAGVEPALASRRGRGRGQARSAPRQHPTREDIRLYLFEEGLTDEQVRATEEYFDTLEIAELAKYFRCLQSGASSHWRTLWPRRGRKGSRQSRPERVCHRLNPRRLHDRHRHRHLQRARQQATPRPWTSLRRRCARPFGKPRCWLLRGSSNVHNARINTLVTTTVAWSARRLAAHAR